MSARLSTAITIGEAAKAILLKTKSFPLQSFDGHEDWSEFEHVGVEPVPLALSMEVALKEWWVFDFDDLNFIKSHNLIKLFDGLLPDSQQKLEIELKRSVAPRHPTCALHRLQHSSCSISTPRCVHRLGVISMKQRSRSCLTKVPLRRHLRWFCGSSESVTGSKR